MGNGELGKSGRGQKVEIKNPSAALAGVAQWIEHQTSNQGVVGLNPSQGTCLGCRPGPQ